MNLYVGNLPYRMTEDALRQEFEQYGQVASCTIIKDKATGQSKGFGFLEMPEHEEAAAAMKNRRTVQKTIRPMRSEIRRSIVSLGGPPRSARPGTTRSSARIRRTASSRNSSARPTPATSSAAAENRRGCCAIVQRVTSVNDS